MIFRYYCIVSDKMYFKFQVKEILPGIYAHKKYLTDELVLIDSFHSSETDYDKGVKYYNFKNHLLKNYNIPLFISAGNYSEIQNTILTQIDIYCLKRDVSFIEQKKKARPKPRFFYLVNSLSKFLSFLK